MNCKVKEFILSYSLISVVMYVAGCVTSASFNISKWTEVTRGIADYVWLLLMFVLSVLILTGKSNPND